MPHLKRGFEKKKKKRHSPKTGATMIEEVQALIFFLRFLNLGA